MTYEIMVEKQQVFIESDGKHDTYIDDVITYIDNDDEIGSLDGTKFIEDLVFFKDGKPLNFTEFIKLFNDGKHVATFSNEIVITVKTISTLYLKTIEIARKVLQFASGQNECLDRVYQEALLAKAVPTGDGYQYALTPVIFNKTLVCVSDEEVVFEETQEVAYSQKVRGLYVYVLEKHAETTFTTKSGKVIYAFTTLPYKKGEI
jgi:hypothetical protein